MAKYELKTKRNDASVAKFLANVPDARRRQDAQALCQLMKEVTGERPQMWGAAIVGFGTYHYKYASGQEGDWMKVGFSPRKTALVIYSPPVVPGYAELLKKLGAHSAGKSCIYVKRLDDLHRPTLKRLIKASVATSDYAA